MDSISQRKGRLLSWHYTKYASLNFNYSGKVQSIILRNTIPDFPSDGIVDKRPHRVRRYGSKSDETLIGDRIEGDIDVARGYQYVNCTKTDIASNRIPIRTIDVPAPLVNGSSLKVVDPNLKCFKIKSIQSSTAP